MSELRLKDGTGGSYTAKVDVDGRLHTRASSVTLEEQRSLDGFGFNFNTGMISVADGSENALAYFKYTGSKNYHLTALAVGVGLLSGTVSNPAFITLVENPTNGTIISSAVDGDINANRNFSAPNIIDGNFYKGVDGDTFTDGEDDFLTHVNGSSRVFATTNFVLGPQNSIGVKVQLNATGGGALYIAFVGHEESE